MVSLRFSLIRHNSMLDSPRGEGNALFRNRRQAWSWVAVIFASSTMKLAFIDWCSR
jgi:hypothetical protein